MTSASLPPRQDLSHDPLHPQYQHTIVGGRREHQRSTYMSDIHTGSSEAPNNDLRRQCMVGEEAQPRTHTRFCEGAGEALHKRPRARSAWCVQLHLMVILGEGTCPLFMTAFTDCWPPGPAEVQPIPGSTMGMTCSNPGKLRYRFEGLWLT